MAEADGRRTSPVLFEGARPLSASLLWRIHRDYFERAGVDAWSHGEVPFLITSGPLLASRYAEVLAGFAQDCAAGRLGPVDTGEPLYVVELGAGSGRLGYLLMQHLDLEAVAPMRIVYVITDLAASNIESFLGRKEFNKFVDAGVMDFARYEAGTDSEIHLERSGIDLAPGNVANPMIGIANYLYCAVPQDLFAVVDGELQEEHVAIFSMDPEPDTASEDFMKQIVLATAHAPVSPTRYGGGRLDRVLAKAAAAESRDGERFLFPAAAIRSIDSLLDVSGGRLCMLIGDRVGKRLAPVDDDDETATSTTAYAPGALIGMGIHGSSISLPVDMELLEMAAEDAGAEMIFQPAKSSSILVSTIVAGDSGEGIDTRRSFARAFGEPTAEDLFVTIKLAASGKHELDRLFAALRVSGYDPFEIVTLYPLLEKLLPDAHEEQKDEFERIAQRAYDLNFPLEMVSDLAFGLGTLAGAAERWECALEYFRRSLEDRGPCPPVLYNEASCLLELYGDDESVRQEAVALLEAATALDSDYTMAAVLRGKVLAGDISRDG